MVTGEVKLNGTKYTYPVCFEELTIGMLERIVSDWDFTKPVAERNYFKLFCIFTGTEYQDFHATDENEVTIYNCIKWFVEHTHIDPFLQNVWPNEQPKVLKIGGKIIDVPQKLAALSIGANIHARQEADKSITVYDQNKKAIEYSCYSIVAAIYLQPFIDANRETNVGGMMLKGVFDFTRAKEIAKEISEMPAYLIRPIGFFLLANVLRYGQKPERHWLKTLTSPIESLMKKSQSLPKSKDSTGLAMVT